jgi:hypothetical protein
MNRTHTHTKLIQKQAKIKGLHISSPLFLIAIIYV